MLFSSVFTKLIEPFRNLLEGACFSARRFSRDSYFIVHYGWSGYNEVVLDVGLIGSNIDF
ncbi:hypothetical protein UF75_2474 [Desulfosporosinus sp. I2]|nr:hypothetical protein UF75_2474 [Desulfosporosinus sp. I2]